MNSQTTFSVANLFSLKGRRGLITGGSMGIGACLAAAFSELGAEVAIAARNLPRAEAKAAVIQLVKAMAVELAPHRIRVNSVSPGYIQTELIAGLKDLLPVWQGMMPEGARLGYPEDLIGAYVYFASDASLYATGSDLVVDGGYTAL